MLDDEDIFKTYKASPIKKKENSELISGSQNLQLKNQDHDFSGEQIEDDNFSFSNNNESMAKEFNDSTNRTSKQKTHKKTNSLNESPLYNAKVTKKQEFFHPDTPENGFSPLQSKESPSKEKTKKKNYTQHNLSNEKKENVENPNFQLKISNNLKNLYSQIMKNNEDYKNRWDFLYDMSKTQREALNIIREAKEKEKNNDPNLTFHPKLHKNIKMSSDFQQRNKIWSEMKKEKIENKKRNDQDKDLDNCTFRPLITDYNSKIINFNSNKYAFGGKGVEQFLRRQILARQAKEEKEALMAHLFYAQQPNEKRIPKGSNITFPKEFKLGSSNLKCPSIRKDFQKALSPTKYQEQYENYQNLEKLSPSKRDENKFNEEKLKQIFQNPNDFHIEKIPFGQALRELHGELHNLDLEIN